MIERRRSIDREAADSAGIRSAASYCERWSLPAGIEARRANARNAPLLL